MAYYGRPSVNRGDYYRGDYYRGDPGFFGNLFRGITRTVGGAISGFLTGGPKGAIVGAVGGAVSAAGANIRSSTLEAGGSESALTPEVRAAHSAAIQRGVMPGGALTGPIGPGLPMVPGAAGVRRHHPNRSTYVTRGGGTSRWPVGLAVHPKGTELVPTRRMNVANPRALRRGIRRIRGFIKIARKAARSVGLTIGRSGRAKKAVRRR